MLLFFVFIVPGGMRPSAIEGAQLAFVSSKLFKNIHSIVEKSL